MWFRHLSAANFRSLLHPGCLRQCFLTLLLFLLITVAIWARIPILELDATDTSLAVSFGEGRLGNQMSSYATLLALQHNFGITPLLTMEQARMMLFYFEHSAELTILEQVMPEWQRYRWTTPFQ